MQFLSIVACTCTCIFQLNDIYRHIPTQQHGIFHAEILSTHVIGLIIVNCLTRTEKL